MELEIAFLQEEKGELANGIKELNDDYQILQDSNLSLEQDRETFKMQYLTTQARMDATIRNVCDAMCDVTDQNRFLIKHGLKGNPKELKSILKSTDDYLVLQSEKNRLVTQIEKKTRRIVAQEVYISDLKVELASAVNQIMKAGLDYTSDVIGDGPNYLQVLRDDYVLPLGGDEDITKLFDKLDYSKAPSDAQSKAKEGEGGGATGQSGDGSNKGAAKFDPTQMTGKELFSHMKSQMNERVIEPASKMVQENIKEPVEKQAGKAVKPALAQAAFGGMPFGAAIGMCCKTCCGCINGCLGRDG